jgi:hypothetical protein
MDHLSTPTLRNRTNRDDEAIVPIDVAAWHHYSPPNRNRCAIRKYRHYGCVNITLSKLQSSGGQLKAAFVRKRCSEISVPDLGYAFDVRLIAGR